MGMRWLRCTTALLIIGLGLMIAVPMLYAQTPAETPGMPTIPTETPGMTTPGTPAMPGTTEPYERGMDWGWLGLLGLFGLLGLRGPRRVVQTTTTVTPRR
jgi:MYXO-CTERM domain-containing protein